MAVVPTADERAPRRVWEWTLGVAACIACAAWIAYRLHVVDLSWNGWYPSVHSLVFRDTTTNGGDMGAHVYWPWFLEHNWFLKGRLQGWSPSWYSGFPIGQYYFPFPAVLTALFDLLLPYNVAFKIVTVLGPVSLPIAAYVFAEQLRFPWPASPAFSVATLYYQFELRTHGTDHTWTIYGGNLASGLAGEYSFTMALSLALFFLGALAYTLRSGKRAWLPAVLLAACVTSHIVVAMFAAFAALIVWLLYRPHRTWILALPVAVVAALLTATWTVPLLATQSYTSSMRYEKVGPRPACYPPSPCKGQTYTDWLFGYGTHFKMWLTGWEIALPSPVWIWALIACAGIGAIWWRRKSTLMLFIWAVTFGAAFVMWPQDLAVWNTRFIPFYFLALAYLAAMGVVELARLAGYVVAAISEWIAEGDRIDAVAAWRAESAVAAERPETVEERALDLDDIWVADVLPEQLPDYLRPHGERERRRLRHRVMAVPIAIVLVVASLWAGYEADRNGAGTAKYWAEWNYEGYEAKPAWPEYRSIMQTMSGLPCGRALWEPSAGTIENVNDPLNQYGTSLSLELLPYFTRGCIGSQEGLYFESSATKDAHFLTVAELAQHPSNPVRGLQYNSTNEFALGVRHARMLGVRYLMFWTPESKALADANPHLRQVATIPDLDKTVPHGWKVYELDNFALVRGLTNEPVVARLHAGTESSCWPNTAKPAKYALDTRLNAWECSTNPWWQNPSLLDQPFALSGPAHWRSVDIDKLGTVTRKPLPPVKVTQVHESVDKISFHVDRIGVPVVVRSSFFPNWKVSGADGPWRLAPNLMTVIPKSHDVQLVYGLTGADWLGRALTLLGFALLALMIAKSRVLRRYGIDEIPVSAPDDDQEPPNAGTDAIEPPPVTAEPIPGEQLGAGLP